MECKCGHFVYRGVSFFELIDTLWNVNRIVVIAVNYRYNGINRYIMECKWQETF